MRRQSRRQLFAEQLEARDCPSLTVQLLSGSLYIKGTPLGAVQVNETAANKLQVLDNTQNLGTYTVTGNLQMTLNSHPNTITVDTMGNRLAGNVLLSLGTGDPAGHLVSVESSVNGGSVGGSITIQGGSGKETMNVGNPGFTPTTFTVGGGVTVNARQSSGGFAGPGDFLFIDPDTTVGGDVNTTLVDNVDVGEPASPLTTVRGNVSINDATSGAALFATIFGNVGKSSTVTGTDFSDFFVLSPAAGVGGNITGNLSVSLGAGGGLGNFIVLDTATTVGGNVNLTSSNIASGGGFGDLIDVAGTINGSLTATLGNGDSTVAFSGSVGGNFRLSAGSGNNTLDFDSATATISGDLTINLGNGSNTATFANAPGGTLYWTSGNGNDSVQLGTANTAPGEFWKVSMRFGTGSDTLTLSDTAPATQFITGFVDMGGPPGGNTFSQGLNWEMVQPWTLQNV